MITISAVKISYTENPLWYQQFDLGQIKKLRAGRPIVGLDAADNCRLNVTVREALNFQDEIAPISNDNCRNNYVLVFDFTSMKYANEICLYPELLGEP